MYLNKNEKALRGIRVATMSLRLYIGPMFAGKSTVAQSTIRRHQAIGWKVCVLTHSLDTRYSEIPAIVSHDQQELPAMAGATLMPFLASPDYVLSKLVVIEEAQFFPDLLEFVDMVVDIHKKHCIVVGLDGDSERRPFGDILKLIPKCNSVEKLNALCKLCGDGTEAPFTYSNHTPVSEGVPVVGSQETYMPLCRNHWYKKREPARNDINYLDIHGC